MKKSIISSLVALLALAGGALAQETKEMPAWQTWALRPPMGWNSWDCFGCTVTEEQVKANADYMAEKLKAFGWEYIIVDIQWYEPQSTGFNYVSPARVLMDAFGRPQPVPSKHPSAAGGQGFKPLADYIHSKGLKFGIHMMRGIPRQAVEQNLPIKGSALRARDIADTKSTCPWNPDMYGVDMSKPGAQTWYDALYEMFAAWEIDYVKVDDLSRPYHKAEVEAIRQAIDRTGRPIVFSTSPGATPLAQGEHVANHANLWRLTDDFWDNWDHLRHSFEVTDAWTPFRAPGHWPDPDMLPLGAVREVNRNQSSWTRFTQDEQYTLMTLFCVTRAPLMFGGHLPRNDAFTLALITNPEILAVQRASINNRQLFRSADQAAWIAEHPTNGNRYLALFNLSDPQSRDDSRAVWKSELITRATPGHAQTVDVKLNEARDLWLVVDDAGDGFTCDHADWIDPYIETAAGTVKLTDLTWRSATAGWGQPAINKSASGQPLQIAGQTYATGIGTHSISIIHYSLSEPASRFQATVGLDYGGTSQTHDGSTVRFLLFTENPIQTAPPAAAVTALLKDCGFDGPCQIRDLWQRKDMGTYTGEFTQTIARHGAGFYQLSKP